MTLETMEVVSFLGSPARMFGRLLLISRYLFHGVSDVGGSRPWAEARFGKSVKWRPWLRYDLKELQAMEELINQGTDEEVIAFQKSQIQAFGMVSIVGALVAGVAATTQQFPAIDRVSYFARGLFILALVMSLLATFFTCLQQRKYGFLHDPAAIRVSLASGVRYMDHQGREAFQSSMVSHQMLQAPFELLCISITCFLGGIGVYLTSCLTFHIDLSSEQEMTANRGMLIGYIITTFFALTLLGQLVGSRETEDKQCRNLFVDFNRIGARLKSHDGAQRKNEMKPPCSTTTSSFRQLSTITSTGPRPKAESAGSPQIQDSANFSTVNNEQPKGLTIALEQAAAAHKACAAADLAVARCYEALM